MTAKEIAKELFGAVKDAVQTVAPGFTLENLKEGVSEVYDKHSHLGASEIANALFSPSGTAFVLYGPDAKKNENIGHGLTGNEGKQEAIQEGKQEAIQEPQQIQQERGGMGM